MDDDERYRDWYSSKSYHHCYTGISVIIRTNVDLNIPFISKYENCVSFARFLNMAFELYFFFDSFWILLNEFATGKFLISFFSVCVGKCENVKID